MNTPVMTQEQIIAAQEAASRARRKEALAMYRAGKTQEEIGRHFKISRARAGQILAKALKDEEL